MPSPVQGMSCLLLFDVMQSNVWSSKTHCILSSGAQVATLNSHLAMFGLDVSLSPCRECVKAHRAVIFILDEFDLFAQVRPHPAFCTSAHLKVSSYWAARFSATLSYLSQRPHVGPFEAPASFA
jgi:hypothetical protein